VFVESNLIIDQSIVDIGLCYRYRGFWVVVAPLLTTYVVIIDVVTSFDAVAVQNLSNIIALL
jgi:hypothetical protein